MTETADSGRIVILNGVPRSGKSSIVAAIQETFEGPWMNLGVDIYVKHITPGRYSPAIGLRPGGEAPDLEPLIVALYSAMYESIAAHSRLGLNVVVDVGHHDCYSRPRGILIDCARRLLGLPVWLVGVRCPLDVIMERRRNTWGVDESEVFLSRYNCGSAKCTFPASRRRSRYFAAQPGGVRRRISRNMDEGPEPSAISRLAAMDQNG